MFPSLSIFCHFCLHDIRKVVLVWRFILVFWHDSRFLWKTTKKWVDLNRLVFDVADTFFLSSFLYLNSWLSSRWIDVVSLTTSSVSDLFWHNKQDCATERLTNSVNKVVSSSFWIFGYFSSSFHLLLMTRESSHPIFQLDFAFLHSPFIWSLFFLSRTCLLPVFLCFIPCSFSTLLLTVLLCSNLFLFLTFNRNQRRHLTREKRVPENRTTVECKCKSNLCKKSNTGRRHIISPTSFWLFVSHRSHQ